jgi:hypothetical protein
MYQPSEKDVLKGINAKDPEALQQLFHMYYSPLRFFAKELIGNDLADEIQDNPFSKLQTEDLHFDTFEKLQAFLYDAVIDVCRKTVQQQPGKFHLLTEKRINQQIESYVIKTEVVRLTALLRQPA